MTGPSFSNEGSTDGGPPVVRVEGVVRRFGGVTAVDEVSLSLGPHERLAIIGPNGAGKTTLFRLIAGELPVSAGRIFLFDQDVTRVPTHQRARMGLARTFQVSNLFVGLSVAENVRIAAQARELDRWRFWRPIRLGDRIGARVDAVLERVGLARRAHDPVAELSHGEQRQLEIAMALVTEPRVLLLDEPAAGLSSGERARLGHILESLPRSLPLLLIEHDMSLALELVGRVLCLHNGRQIALGPPDHVRNDSLVQAVYLGRSAGA